MFKGNSLVAIMVNPQMVVLTNNNNNKHFYNGQELLFKFSISNNVLLLCRSSISCDLLYNKILLKYTKILRALIVSLIILMIQAHQYLINLLSLQLLTNFAERKPGFSYVCCQYEVPFNQKNVVLQPHPTTKAAVGIFVMPHLFLVLGHHGSPFPYIGQIPFRICCTIIIFSLFF